MTRKTQSLQSSKERGAVAILFALTAVVLIGFTGLAIDVGYMQWQKGRIQSAADAAAMGALRELELNQTDLTTAGQYDASLNGFKDGENQTTVKINNPPTSGPYSTGPNASSAVEAIVTRTVPTFFMRMFGQDGITISGRAVARTTNTQGSVGGCIFALDKTANNTFEISGSSVVTTSCGVMVNSDSTQAFVNSGGGSLKLGNGAKIGVVGTSVISGGSTVVDTTTNKSESPVAVQSFADPLANLPVPTTSDAGSFRNDNGGSTWNIDSGHMPANNQLNPGIYCGGLSINSTLGTLTFQPGIYILAGGGLTVSSNATIQGSGVMFYNTQTSSSQTWGCSKNNLNAVPIKVQGGLNSVTMSAPASGNWSGILFFEDRNLSQTLSSQVTGGSSIAFNGALYFLHGNLTFSGSSSGSGSNNNGYLVLVADTITISGTSNLNNDKTDLQNVYTLAPATTGGGLVQ
jgi:Flp pilus assembly protein TadG